MTEIRTYLEALMLTDDQPLTLESGRVLFKDGDPADGRMYVVRSGSIELRSDGDVLETVGPGGMVGELALIDPAPRSATAVAIATSSLTAVDAHLFHKLVRQVPGLALEMMRVLARRLRDTTARVKAAANRQVARRKAARKPAKRKPAARPKLVRKPKPVRRAARSRCG